MDGKPGEKGEKALQQLIGDHENVICARQKPGEKSRDKEKTSVMETAEPGSAFTPLRFSGRIGPGLIDAKLNTYDTNCNFNSYR